MKYIYIKQKVMMGSIPHITPASTPMTTSRAAATKNTRVKITDFGARARCPCFRDPLRARSRHDHVFVYFDVDCRVRVSWAPLENFPISSSSTMNPTYALKFRPDNFKLTLERRCARVYLYYDAHDFLRPWHKV